jgi:hypothetical protein
MVLLTLVLTTMMIRIVGFAAQGEIDPRDVLVLIGLTVIGYLAIMLVATLFVSILFVLTRWYKDSEMVVWLSSGVSLTRFIKPIGIFADPRAFPTARRSFAARARPVPRIGEHSPRVLHREDVARPGPCRERVRDEHGERQGQRGRVQERPHRNA